MIPSVPVPFWQYFDVVVIVIVTSVIFWLMLTHKNRTGGLHPSISQTIAADRRSSLIFSLMMTVCVPLYYSFLWFWVGPIANAPWCFYGLLALSVISEMIFVWVPATTGKSKKVHEITVSFVGIVMLAVPLILLFAGDITQSAQLGVVFFAGITLLLSVLLLMPSLRKYTLSYEIVYCAVFWALMSYIAHG